MYLWTRECLLNFGSHPEPEFGLWSELALVEVSILCVLLLLQKTFREHQIFEI